MKIMAIAFSVGLILGACQKPTDLQSFVDHEVTYEVTTSEGEWFGEWIDGKTFRTTMTSPPWNNTGWKYTFKPEIYPIELTCHASTTCICRASATSPDIKVNIYVDGVLVKSELNNMAKGVTTAVYELER